MLLTEHFANNQATPENDVLGLEYHPDHSHYTHSSSLFFCTVVVCLPLHATALAIANWSFVVKFYKFLCRSYP